MTNQGKAYLFAGSAVALWSTVASAFKLTLRFLDPWQLVFFATTSSALVLGCLLVLQGKHKGLFTLPRVQYLHALGLGLLNPLIYYAVLFKAYDLLPAQVAQPLNYTWALTLAYLSVPLLKQKLGFGEVVAGLVCYSGVLIISTNGEPFSLDVNAPFGVALALASTVIWALYWIANARADRDPVVGLFLQFCLCIPFAAAACGLFSRLEVPNLWGLLGAGYIGIFEMGITFVLWGQALRLSESTGRISNLIFLSPFLSLLFIQGLVGETILPSTLIGLVLIVAGLVIQHSWPRWRMLRLRA